MLTYAFRDVRFNIDDDIAGEKFEEIHELFAEILIRGVSHLLKKGLFKTYESNEGTLTTIRGKIHLYKTCELEQTNPNHYGSDLFVFYSGKANFGVVIQIET